MKMIIYSIVSGIVTYIVATNFMDAMVTGTTLSDSILTNIVPIVIPVGVILAIIRQHGNNLRSF